MLDKVPELSVQSLSALIKRDSKRSELDEVIADALGVDLLWLVYGKTNSSRVKTLPKRESKEISEILSILSNTDHDGHVKALTAVKFALADHVMQKQKAK